MSVFTYQKHSAKLIKVLKDGVFLGFLTQEWRRASTGLSSRGWNRWSIRIDGSDIQGTTLTQVKAKIEGKIDVKTGQIAA